MHHEITLWYIIYLKYYIFYKYLRITNILIRIDTLTWVFGIGELTKLDMHMKGSIRTIVFYFILTKKKIRWLACVSKKKMIGLPLENCACLFSSVRRRCRAFFRSLLRCSIFLLSATTKSWCRWNYDAFCALCGMLRRFCQRLIFLFSTTSSCFFLMKDWRSLLFLF